MTAIAEAQLAERPSLVARAWSGLLAAWGAFIGVLPHVLHHVGPLAGGDESPAPQPGIQQPTGHDAHH